MLKITIALLLNIGLTIQLFSQTVPEVKWYKTFNGSGNGVDMVNDVKLDSQNNIFLAGRTAESDGFAHGLLILKYSAEGDSLLSIKYSDYESWDEANSIAVSTSGDIYVSGRSSNTGLLKKYDSNGNIQWTNYYQEDSSVGEIIKLDSNENPIHAYLDPYSSLKISKYVSSTGEPEWTTIIEDDTSSYDVSDIVIDEADNSYVTVNQTYGCGSDVPCFNTGLLKLNTNGEIVWRFNVASASTSELGIDNNQNPTLIVHRNDISAQIIKLNPNSDTLWTKEYNSGFTILTDMTFDSQNNLIVSGYRPLDHLMSYMTEKISSEGSNLWTQYFSNEDSLKGYAQSVTVDNNDNIFVTGSSHDSINRGVLNTIKYSETGESEWVHSFEAPNGKFNRGTHIFVNDDEEIFIGGRVADIENGWDFLAMKIIQKVGVSTENAQQSTPNSIHLNQNFPNPFNPSTNIQFVLPEKSHVQIEVYDSMGRRVEKLANRTYSAGSHSIDFNAENLSSGIYFYRLIASNTVITKQMVLIK